MKVIFKKKIRGSMVSADVWLVHVAVMSFVPHVGMGVSEGVWYGKVESLHYNNEHLYAYTPSDEGFYRKDGGPMEDIVAEYIEAGWERSLDSP